MRRAALLLSELDEPSSLTLHSGQIDAARRNGFDLVLALVLQRPPPPDGAGYQDHQGAEQRHQVSIRPSTWLVRVDLPAHSADVASMLMLTVPSSR